MSEVNIASLLWSLLVCWVLSACKSTNRIAQVSELKPMGLEHRFIWKWRQQYIFIPKTFFHQTILLRKEWQQWVHFSSFNLSLHTIKYFIVVPRERHEFNYWNPNVCFNSTSFNSHGSFLFVAFVWKWQNLSCWPPNMWKCSIAGSTDQVKLITDKKYHLTQEGAVVQSICCCSKRASSAMAQHYHIAVQGKRTLQTGNQYPHRVQ